MSLVKSLNSGVSGLRAFQTKMDVIGNNISNVETAGYKSSRVTFAEMMSARLGRDGGGESAPQLSNQVGLGIRVASIDRNFSQGAMQNTGVKTDLAIEGDGFFVVSNNGENMMTRAGNFVFNKDGFLVDPSGRKVQGYNADQAGNVLGGSTSEDIKIDFENILPPKQTSIITMAGNLDAGASTNRLLMAQTGFTDATGASASLTTDLNSLGEVLTPLTAGDQIAFDITNNDGTTNSITYTYATGDTLGDLVDSFNTQLTAAEGELSVVDGVLKLKSGTLGESSLSLNNTSITGTGDINFPNFKTIDDGTTSSKTVSTTVYDELGNAHSLMLEMSQVNSNEWQYSANFLDGESVLSGATGTITFDSLGQLTSSSKLDITFEPGNGASTASFSVSLGDTDSGVKFTQYAGTNSSKIIGQDGYAQGQLVDVSIDGAGQIQGIYDNGNSTVLAQLALAQVQNNNGLEMVGSGLYRASSAAGEIFVDKADTFAGTAINAGSLEGSNVDLTKEFTDMITSQRAYQSSARVITTSDEMLTEAVNLKR